MASFESFLQIGGRQYSVYYSDFQLHQYTDSLSRLASPTFGGPYFIEIEVPPSGDQTLYRWAIDPTRILNGQVLFKNLDSNTTLKVIKFYNAYCVDLEDLFDGTGTNFQSRSFRTRLSISPQAVEIGGHFHDNNWPGGEPIVDWNWADMDAECNPKARPLQEAIASKEEPKKEPGWFSELAHTALDVVGMIPVVGEIADGANALLYAAEGDYANAAMSAASMVPLAGNVVGAAKLAKRSMKVVEKVRGLKKAQTAARQTAQKLAKGGRNALKEIEGHIIESIPERTLSFDKVRFTHKAVDKVADHLSRFGPFTANTKMVERLKGIADGTIQATDYDRRFLTHELREMVRMRISKAGLGEVNGNPFNEAAYRVAHDAALREYGLFVKGYDKLLYHPDAIKAGEIAGDWF